MQIGLANFEYPAGDAIMRLYNSPIGNHVIPIFFQVLPDGYSQ